MHIIVNEYSKKNKNTRVFFLFFLIALYSGCMSFYPVTDENRLNNFPTFSHNNEVQLFFPGEKPPDTSFIKIGFLDVKHYEDQAYEELLSNLKDKAQSYGVDAIIILTEELENKIEKNNKLLESVFELASTIDTSTLKTNAILTGLGIKYIKNITYLEDFIKSKDVYINTSSKDNYKLAGTLFVDFEGNDSKTVTKRRQGLELYEEYVKPYSYQFLVLEKSDFWSFQNDFKGRVSKRTLLNEEGFPALKCSFTYDDDDRISQITTKNLLTFSMKRSIIELSYDEKNNLIEKNIITENDEAFREYFTYDENDKLTESELFKIMGRREVPFIKITYSYYTKDDLNNL